MYNKGDTKPKVLPVILIETWFSMANKDATTGAATEVPPTGWVWPPAIMRKLWPIPAMSGKPRPEALKYDAGGKLADCEVR